MDIINLMIYGTCEDWRTRNRRDVSQWIGAYRAKRELYTRYFGSVEDAETTLVDGRLDWTELRERLLSRNYGGVAQGWLSTETGKEVSLSLRVQQ